MSTNNTRITLDWRESNDDVFLRKALQQRDLDVLVVGQTVAHSYRWEKKFLSMNGRNALCFGVWLYGSEQIVDSPLDTVDPDKLTSLFGNDWPQWIVEQCKGYDRYLRGLPVQSNQDGAEMSLKPDPEGSVVRTFQSFVTDVAEANGVSTNTVYSMLEATLPDFCDGFRDLVATACARAEASSTATDVKPPSSRYDLRSRDRSSADTFISNV